MHFIAEGSDAERNVDSDDEVKGEARQDVPGRCDAGGRPQVVKCKTPERVSGPTKHQQPIRRLFRLKSRPPEERQSGEFYHDCTSWLARKDGKNNVNARCDDQADPIDFRNGVAVFFSRIGYK